jgi:hypothetical protein
VSFDSQSDINCYFEYACKSNNLELIKFIFEQGAIISEDLLIKTCSCTDIEISKFLIDNFYGKIPFVEMLKLTCNSGNNQFLKYLIGKGADINSSPKLMYECFRNNNNLIDTIKVLVENNYNMNQSSAFLEYCHEKIEVMEYLYCNGLDIHLDDDFALRIVTFRGSVDMCKFLLSKGANIHANNEQPLINSIIRYTFDISMFKLLVENGADINIKINDEIIQKYENFSYRRYGSDKITIVKYVLNKDIDKCNFWFDKLITKCSRMPKISQYKNFIFEAIYFLKSCTIN